MRKKILLGCLAAICAVTGGLALASCAPAEQLAYEKIAGEEAYRVVGIGTMKTRDVVIPATYEGLPVTELGENLFAGGNIKSVVLPDTLKKIGRATFYNCDDLTSVTLADGLETIGESAFRDCDNLKEISFPNSLKSIYKAAFYKSGLTAANLPQGLSSIGDSAFAYCDDLTTVSMPDSVVQLGASAFRNCESLRSINLSASLLELQESLFAGCLDLTSIVIPEGVALIKNNAFSSCVKLIEVCNKSEDLTIVKGSSENGGLGYYAYAVYNSDDLYTTSISTVDDFVVYADGSAQFLLEYVGTQAEISISSEVTTVYDYAFYGNQVITKVTLPESVERIGGSAFKGCANLREVSLPTSLRFVGGNVFTDCPKLGGNRVGELLYLGNAQAPYLYLLGVADKGIVSAQISDACKFIGSNAFQGCGSLTSIVVPDSVGVIGDSAFNACLSLSSVTIGKNVYDVGNYAFYCCESLSYVYLPTKVARMGSYVFFDCAVDLVIDCERSSKPTSWADDWNGGDYVVNWDK